RPPLPMFLIAGGRARGRGGRPEIALATELERIITTRASWHQERAGTNLKAQLASPYAGQLSGGPGPGSTRDREVGRRSVSGAVTVGGLSIGLVAVRVGVDGRPEAGAARRKGALCLKRRLC